MGGGGCMAASGDSSQSSASVCGRAQRSAGVGWDGAVSRHLGSGAHTASSMPGVAPCTDTIITSGSSSPTRTGACCSSKSSRVGCRGQSTAAELAWGAEELRACRAALLARHASTAADRSATTRGSTRTCQGAQVCYVWWSGVGGWWALHSRWSNTWQSTRLLTQPPARHVRFGMTVERPKWAAGMQAAPPAHQLGRRALLAQHAQRLVQAQRRAGRGCRVVQRAPQAAHGCEG